MTIAETPLLTLTRAEADAYRKRALEVVANGERPIEAVFCEDCGGAAWLSTTTGPRPIWKGRFLEDCSCTPPLVVGPDELSHLTAVPGEQLKFSGREPLLRRVE